MPRKVLVADDLAPLVRDSWKSGTAYNVGYNYFIQARTEVLSARGDQATIRVKDKHNKAYVVRVRLAEGKASAACECKLPGGEHCEHTVAACHALQRYLRENPPFVWQSALSSVVNASRPGKPAKSRNSVIVFSLSAHSYGGVRISPYLISCRDLPAELPADAQELACLIHAGRATNEARPIYSRSDFSTIRNATAPVIAAVSLVMNSGFYQESLFHSLVSLLPNCPLFRSEDTRPLALPLTVDFKPASVVLLTERDDDGVRLTLGIQHEGQPEPEPLAKERLVLSRKPFWLLSGQQIFPVAESAELLDVFVRYPEGMTIPAGEVEEFTTEFLTPLAERLPVAGAFAPAGEVRADPVKRIFLEETDGEFAVRLCFGYAEQELPYSADLPDSSIARTLDNALLRIYRQPEAEASAWKELNNFGLKRGSEPGTFILRKSVSVVDFLIHQVPRLAAAGFEIYGEEALTSARVNRSQPSLSLNVSSGIDWFDVDAIVRFGELDIAWAEVAKAMRRRERYIKLADGSIGMLPEEWLERYRRVLGLVEEGDAGMRLAPHQITVLEALLDSADDSHVDAEFARRRERLRNIQGIAAHPLPQGLHGELRAYQKAGFDWLHFLHEYGFGGCLADDMGTGKTIQALTFLQSLKESGEAQSASLVVVPRSLLFNWQREAAQFTPELRVGIHADAQRDQTLASFADYDVVLTTYGVMLRDIAKLRDYRFHYVLLDESQAIKNPNALTARAARNLTADHRLVLTGTPVENSTLELWSQFAFLNPGLLGGFEYFRKEFALPIERQHDEGAAQLLRRMVFPFILRRTKEQVAADLPPRTERIIYCEMDPAQQRSYVKSRDYYRAHLLGLIDEGGMNQARMKVLEGLLRLRQISNHPRLADPDFKGTSGKFDELLEMLKTLRAEGHKALVFSQFTQMLKLVREALDAREIPYVYLDGQTRDRAARVDTFQENSEIPFFLISLKAGGVGLNLTAADYVIHIDPWWNPAVEMQAADRAHRIGQDKPVFIYRMIMRGSVEEKILQLQASKRELVNSLIQTDTGVIKSLNRSDVEVLFS